MPHNNLFWFLSLLRKLGISARKFWVPYAYTLLQKAGLHYLFRWWVGHNMGIAVLQWCFTVIKISVIWFYSSIYSLSLSYWLSENNISKNMWNRQPSALLRACSLHADSDRATNTLEMFKTVFREYLPISIYSKNGISWAISVWMFTICLVTSLCCLSFEFSSPLLLSFTWSLIPAFIILTIHLWHHRNHRS